jgi:hypothetical protein
VRASRPFDQKAALLKSRVRSTRSLLRSTRPLPVLVGWHETATRVRSMKNRRSYRMLVALFLALVPASGVLAQIAGPDYAVAPSVCGLSVFASFDPNQPEIRIPRKVLKRARASMLSPLSSGRHHTPWGAGDDSCRLSARALRNRSRFIRP